MTIAQFLTEMAECYEGSRVKSKSAVMAHECRNFATIAMNLEDRQEWGEPAEAPAPDLAPPAAAAQPEPPAPVPVIRVAPLSPPEPPMRTRKRKKTK